MKGKDKKNILLVEDEILIAMGKQQELEKYGYTVQHVNTGEKAVNIASENIDLLLMDIDLGKGIDGTEAAALILEEHNIPIVFMSSHTEPEIVEKTEKITSYGYVVKSSSITVLDASIKMAFKLFNARSNIDLLSKTAMTFVEFPRDGNIYDFVGEQIRKFVDEDSYIVINSVDQETGASTIQSVYGISKFAKIITDKLGSHPVGMKFDAKDPNIHYQDGKLHVYQEGLYGLLLNTVPKTICQSLEKLTNVKKIYVIDLARKERFFGSVIIFLKEETGELKNKGLIETFIKQASIAILKRHAEEALCDSEENLSITLNSIGDCVISTDKNGLIVQINPTAEKLCGWKLADALGKPLSEVFQIINAETRETVTNPVRNVLENGEIVGMANHTVLISKDGKEYQIADRAAPIKTNDGLINGVVLVFSDVTEQYLAEQQIRKSEGKYRSLTDDVLDSSAVGIFILDSDFSVVWVNQATEDYFGLKRNEIVGKDKRQLIRERIKDVFENPDSFADKVISTYDDNTYDERFECHVLPDYEREERWLEHRSQPIQSGLYAGGRIEHYYDITEHKQLKDEIEKNNTDLERLVETRTSELENKNKELEHFNSLFVDREFRIKELRDQVKELKATVKGEGIL